LWNRFAGLCMVDALVILSSILDISALGNVKTRWEERMSETEMTIDGIRVAFLNYQRTLVLKAKEKGKYLTIWIGPCEADSISIILQNVHLARPLTHDFLCAVIEKLGATVKSVVVDKLEDSTFHAKVILMTDEGEIDMDCRPSDAVAVAVRAKAPIFVDNEVLDRAGIDLETDNDL
jgi:bifunctional DNase/RNase